MKATNAGVIPPSGLVDALRERAGDKNLSTIAAELGLSRAVVAAVMAGLRVRRGSVVLVAQALGWPGKGAA